MTPTATYAAKADATRTVWEDGSTTTVAWFHRDWTHGGVFCTEPPACYSSLIGVAAYDDDTGAETVIPVDDVPMPTRLAWEAADVKAAYEEATFG